MSRISIKQGFSDHPDPQRAIREVAAQIFQPDSALNIIYFTNEYIDNALAPSFRHLLKGPLIGCSTARLVGAGGYKQSGISGLSLQSEHLDAFPYLIPHLSTATTYIEKISAEVKQQTDRTALPAFGLLLIDGLSLREEFLTASLYRSLGNIPIIGGSAGDMLEFKETFILFEAALYKDAAVFTTFLTSLPFITFKQQHFKPTSTRLVITEADPAKRIVHEINGENAVKAYADAISVPIKDLNASVFSTNPLILKLLDDYYIRSIADIENESLRFYCAIDKGLVLTVGHGHFNPDVMVKDLKEIEKCIGRISVIIGCDCILRRLEMDSQGLLAVTGKRMAEQKVYGFSTYGEQFNSVHVNQTFTGIAIGE